MSMKYKLTLIIAHGILVLDNTSMLSPSQLKETTPARVVFFFT